MKKLSIKYKITAALLVLAFTFQSMESINSHTYSAGLSNFHAECPKRITCCFGHSYHSIYNCGNATHIN
ncbi:hypothetical protein DFQ09_11011 [Winogradskyella pacifica]|uniref:Uncharacterized protein n=1 Tax=Winogradskyella pacifica TaxID=664642 RepID=A0A3D9LN39_9FLAO|nr:hypothetical protein DFQ09_11011 [Winogradskyella pacifica]